MRKEMHGGSLLLAADPGNFVRQSFHGYAGFLAEIVMLIGGCTIARLRVAGDCLPDFTVDAKALHYGDGRPS